MAKNNFFRSMVKELGDVDTHIAEDAMNSSEFSGTIDTGSYILNAALSGSIFGGVPNNKIIAFAGESATGKTFFVLGMMKQFLDDNEEGGVIYYDTEAAVTKEMMVDRGIDTSRVIISEVATVEGFRTHVSRTLDRYMEAAAGDRPPMMMVLDSLGQLSTNKETGDINEGKDARDMTRAQLIRGTFRALSLKLARANVPLIVTNHVADQIGVCEVIFDMSAQAFLPAIVPPEQLEKANGRLFATEVICNTFLGLPLGAWAFVAAIGTPFAVNAASFGVAAYLVGTIRVDFPPPGRADDTGGRSFLEELGDGLRWLFRHPLLRTLAVLLGLCNMATMMGQALFVKYASDELGVTGAAYGVLLAIMSAGSIAGGLLGDRVASRWGITGTVVVPYAMFGIASLAMGIWTNVPVAVVASAATSIAGTVWNVSTVSLRQRLIPSHLFGRVNSAYRFLGTGFITVGAAIGGFIAKSHGYSMPFTVGGVIILAALAIGIRPVLSYGRSYAEPATPAPPSIT